MSKITKKELNERLLMVETLLGLHRALPEQISNDQANNAIFRMQCALSSGKELAERNPTEVEQRIEALEEFATYAENMLTELNHALPDPEYDAKCEAQEADIDASLDRHRERLGLNKPQLKQIDQSVFEGVFDWVKSAAVNPDGSAYLFSVGKDGFYNISDKYGFQITGRDKCKCIGLGYDASNWQNSLIERDVDKELLEVDLSSEITGSELCKAMLKRGDKRIMCVSLSGYAMVITGFDGDKFVDSRGAKWGNAAPINNQDEPLTASEAGL